MSFKPTRHHFNFKNWIDDLKKNIEHSRYLIDTYPDDPRSLFELSMLNSYEKLYNFLTNREETTYLVEDYQTLLRVVEESKLLRKKFKKEVVEISEEVVISQTQIASAPELAQLDAEHAQEMEALDVKKKKKVKSK